MPIARDRIFLTLVLAPVFAAAMAAHAAPAPPQPQLDEPILDSGAPTEIPDPAVSGTIDITEVQASGLEPAPGGGIVSSEYFYRYRKSISPRIGTIYGVSEYAENGRLLYQVGFQYLFRTRSLKSFEAGADLISDGSGRVHYARRWFLSFGRTRPYFKAGGGFKIVPSDGLATFLKYEHLQARLAAGVERLLLAPMSLRAEIELLAGLNDIEAIASLGYSWAW